MIPSHSTNGQEDFSPLRLISELEEQQEWFAQVLHRTLCQSLSGANLLLQLLERGNGASTADALPWQDLRQSLSGSMQELHGIMDWLRAHPMAGIPLPIALRELAASRGVAFFCDIPEACPALQPGSALARVIYFLASTGTWGKGRLQMQLSHRNGVISFFLKSEDFDKTDWLQRIELLEPALQSRARIVGASFTVTSDEIRLIYPAPRTSLEDVPCSH